MGVLGLDAGIRAQFNVGDPRALQDILDENPVIRVWLEYSSEDRPARARREVLDRRGIQRGLFLFLLLLPHALREGLRGRGGKGNIRD